MNNRSFVATTPQDDAARHFVSRGGIKLQAALDKFQIDPSGKVILDVGSSTGGFVDCLLQNGAAKVYALDTAYGELAWKLRNDPRVVVMERTNILHLTNLPVSHPEPFDSAQGKLREGSLANTSQNKSGDSSKELESPQDSLPPQNDDTKVDIVTIDAGWTKLELILPKVKQFLKEGGQIIALLKPHYEADKSDLVKGVLPKEKAEEVKDQVTEKIKRLGFKVKEEIDSPILGGGGNREYLIYLASNS